MFRLMAPASIVKEKRSLRTTRRGVPRAMRKLAMAPKIFFRVRADFETWFFLFGIPS